MGRDGKLPKEILSLVSAHLQRDERILFAQASDLTLDRRFGPCHMVITDARIAVFDGDKLALTLELTRIKKIKVDELFGSARLVAETSEGDRHLIYYSKAYVPQFAGLCRVVSDLLDGRQPVPPEDVKRLTARSARPRCPSAARTAPCACSASELSNDCSAC